MDNHGCCVCVKVGCYFPGKRRFSSFSFSFSELYLTPWYTKSIICRVASIKLSSPESKRERATLLPSPTGSLHSIIDDSMASEPKAIIKDSR